MACLETNSGLPPLPRGRGTPTRIGHNLLPAPANCPPPPPTCHNVPMMTSSTTSQISSAYAPAGPPPRPTDAFGEVVQACCSKLSIPAPAIDDVPAVIERVFSLMSNTFDEGNRRALRDYIETSLMLQFNRKRKRG